MKKSISVIVLISILIVVLCIRIVPEFIIDFTNFNSNVWNKYPDKRYEMIEDFESKFVAEELTKENVTYLLGNRYVSKRDKMYSYTIGGNLISTKYYAIIFDEQGKCIKRYIYVD